MDIPDETSHRKYPEEQASAAWGAWATARGTINEAKIRREYPGFKPPTQQQYHKKVIRWRCQKEGHLAKDCKAPKAVPRTGGYTPGQASSAFSGGGKKQGKGFQVLCHSGSRRKGLANIA